MIIQTKELQEACKVILGAVDTDSALKNVAFGYDTLELNAEGKVLNLNVTNGEYYVNVPIALEVDETFRAVVDAKLFLSLISKITTNTVELSTTESALVVQANGKYTFPLKVDVNGMIVLPKIEINHPTSDFVMPSKTLISILDNNTNSINANATMRAQKLYYLDQEGCLTFTSASACINSFTLPTTTKLMLTPKLVKLFRLFKGDDVKVVLGFEQVNETTQARVSFSQGSISVTAILNNDENLVSSVPVKVVRGMANKVFANNVAFDKKYFLEVIDRLLLFDTTNAVNRGVGVFEFHNTFVNVFDSKKNNSEEIGYASGTCPADYTANIDLEAMKTILLNSDDPTFNLSFGDSRAVVISSGNVKNVISER